MAKLEIFGTDLKEKSIIWQIKNLNNVSGTSLFFFYSLSLDHIRGAFNKFPDLFCTGIYNCHRLLKI